MTAAAPRPPLSVVVPTRDRPAHLARCLAALTVDLRPGDEIVVVDSASRRPVRAVELPHPPLTRPELSRPQDRVRLLRAPRPGTSLARNLGWRAARHPIVAFVDDDVTVLPGWADAVVAALGAAGVGFVTGWIGVAPEQAGVAEPTPLMVAGHSFPIDRSRRGLLGAGANLAARRSALLEVGGFDERLGPGNRIAAGEDHDLLDRLLACGVTGRYDAHARVYHDQWRSRRRTLVLHWRMGLGAGARLARLARADPGRLPMVAREVVVDDIAAAIVGSVRAGYQTGTVLAVLRLLGLLAGVVTAPAGARSIAIDRAAAGG